MMMLCNSFCAYPLTRTSVSTNTESLSVISRYLHIRSLSIAFFAIWFIFFSTAFNMAHAQLAFAQTAGPTAGPTVGNSRLALGGFEGGPGNTYSYLGLIQPLHKNLGDSIITRVWLDRLSYTYDKGGEKIHGEALGGEGALGYRNSGAWGWWAAFAGLLYRDTHFSPDDPDSRARGGVFRAKLQLEGERNLTDRWRANAIISFVPGQNSYWTRARVLYRFGNIISTGPEVIGLGDPDYNIQQFGWTVVGIPIASRLQVNLRGGGRIIQGVGTVGYGGVEIGYPF